MRLTKITLSEGIVTLILALFSWNSSLFAESCFTQNGSALLAYPGGIEGNIGFTVGSAHVNPQSSCAGAMFDVGASVSGYRAAVGYRGFQRYDWPSGSQYNAFLYRRRAGDSSLPGDICVGAEAGLSVMLIMMRAGIGVCSPRDQPYLGIGVGMFY